LFDWTFLQKQTHAFSSVIAFAPYRIFFFPQD